MILEEIHFSTPKFRSVAHLKLGLEDFTTRQERHFQLSKMLKFALRNPVLLNEVSLAAKMRKRAFMDARCRWEIAFSGHQNAEHWLN
jgi:hypothetical protein